MYSTDCPKSVGNLSTVLLHSFSQGQNQSHSACSSDKRQRIFKVW